MCGFLVAIPVAGKAGRRRSKKALVVKNEPCSVYYKEESP